MMPATRRQDTTLALLRVICDLHDATVGDVSRESALAVIITRLHARLLDSYPRMAFDNAKVKTAEIVLLGLARLEKEGYIEKHPGWGLTPMGLMKLHAGERMFTEWSPTQEEV